MDKYELMLAKYIAHIKQAEGIDYIDHIGDPQASNIEFTAEEIAELKELSKLTFE